MSDIQLSKKTNKDEEFSGSSSIDGNDSSDEISIKPMHKKRPLKQKLKDFFANPKKRLIFEGSVGILLIAIFGTGIYLLTHENSTTSSDVANTKKVTEAPKQLYQSLLDGTFVTDEAAANKHPLAIIVENDPAARPQSGLDKANIVYETVYDPAATTRFLAIFGNTEAEKVGPIRSVRTFFVDWAHGYDAFLGHWGGNMDALDKIKKEGAPDLDEFAYANLYWRDNSSKTSSEHTGYTSTIKLREQAEKNKYSTANNFNVYKFKDEPKDAEKLALPATQNITVDFSNASYLVDFTYDKESNSYKRNLAGKAHNDKISGEQLTAKNVIMMAVNRKQTTTRINESGYTMDTVGTGKAQIFLDGKQINATWKKESASTRELFFDESGQEIVFNRGKFWICVVPTLAEVMVK